MGLSDHARGALKVASWSAAIVLAGWLLLSSWYLIPGPLEFAGLRHRDVLREARAVVGDGAGWVCCEENEDGTLRVHVLQHRFRDEEIDEIAFEIARRVFANVEAPPWGLTVRSKRGTRPGCETRTFRRDLEATTTGP